MSGEAAAKHIVIVGAGSGTGRATALAAGAKGWLVSLADTDASVLAEAVEILRKRGGTAAGGTVHVSTRAAGAAWLREAVGACGPLAWQPPQECCSVASQRTSMTTTTVMWRVDYLGVVRPAVDAAPLREAGGAGSSTGRLLRRSGGWPQYASNAAIEAPG